MGAAFPTSFQVGGEPELQLVKFGQVPSATEHPVVLTPPLVEEATSACEAVVEPCTWPKDKSEVDALLPSNLTVASPSCAQSQ